MGNLQRHYINLGGTVGNLGSVKFGFKAPDFAYDNIATGLGVVEVKDDNRSGIVYGANSPRPVRVRISFNRAGALAGIGGAATGNGSVIRFCEPDKLNAVLFGSLNALKVKTTGGVGTGNDINNVTIKGGS